LSGWAKWGAEQKREDLIAAAEELLSANRDVDYLANAVPALRQEWKRLNGQAAPAHGEWERFDAALSKAYQPVAVQRAEEAARRAQARSDKEALCVQWDAFVAANRLGAPRHRGDQVRTRTDAEPVAHGATGGLSG